LPGEPPEYASGGCSIASAYTPKRRRYRGLYGAAVGVVDPGAARAETETRATLIAWIVHTREQSLCNQPLEDTGERAGVDVKQCGEVAGGEAREQTGDAKDEPLRSGHPNVRAHAFRRLVQPVDERPQQSHELQDVRKRLGDDRRTNRVHAG
jgi:hypothetical protein